MTNNHRTARPTRCLQALTMSGVLLTAGLGASQAASPAAAATVSVTVQSAQQAAIAQTVRAYGVVSASPGQVNTMSSGYGVRLTQVRVALGQTVSRGQTLYEVMADPASVLAASQAASAVRLAAGELQRTRALLDAHLATQSQLAAAQKALDDAQQAQAAQQRLGVSSQPLAIRAPFDAVVTQLSATQGDQLQAGAAVMQLTRRGAAAAATLVLGVDPAGAAGLHEGSPLTGTDLSSGQTIAGRVVSIGNTLDGQTQLVNVTAQIGASAARVFAGSKVRVDIVQSDATHWVVPRNAVLKDTQGAYLFQVRSGTARRVPVTIAVEQADRYGIDGALDAAQPVVVSGNYELSDGVQVRMAGGAAK